MSFAKTIFGYEAVSERVTVEIFNGHYGRHTHVHEYVVVKGHGNYLIPVGKVRDEPYLHNNLEPMMARQLLSMERGWMREEQEGWQYELPPSRGG